MIDILYFFDNSQYSIVELKINQMPDPLPKNWIYHWLMIDKYKNEVMRLEFVSMNQSKPIQSRVFSQGELEFDSTMAKLKIVNQIFELQTCSIDQLGLTEQKMLQNYAMNFLNSLPLLQTERTYSRLGLGSDIPAIIEFHQKNDRDHFAAWNPELPENFYTPEFWQTRLERSLVEFEADESLRLFTFSSYTHQVIASVSVTNFVRGPFQNCCLGYKIDKEHEGQGLMKETLESVINYLFTFLKFHRIEANYIPTNIRSAKLLERLRFEKHGIAKEYLKINSRWQDHVLTSLINADYK